MTESSNNTKQHPSTSTELPPKKPIEMPSNFKDVTSEGGVDIFIGVQGVRKQETKKDGPGEAEKSS